MKTKVLKCWNDRVPVDIDELRKVHMLDMCRGRGQTEREDGSFI